MTTENEEVKKHDVGIQPDHNTSIIASMSDDDK
jgi:hypothetical protein